VIDLVLTEDDEDPSKVLMHRLDCPMVAQHRAQERPVVTLFGVEKGSFADEQMPRHTCLRKS
jgi:hypothetical protein